ncbi:antiterminator LoaP [Thermophilibacter sp.]
MARWYVVQVATGKEATMCELIQRVAPEGVLEECFTPRYQTQKKVRGEWVYVQKVLFPGYLIAVTDRVDELWAALRGVSEFTRLLSVGEAFAPLSDEDRAWISVFTEKGARVVPMSMGVIEGDRVIVTQGPLVGQEALIRRVDRKRSTAYLELKMFGRTLTTKVGLGIVARRRTAE